MKKKILGLALMGGLLMASSGNAAPAPPNPLAAAATPNGKIIMEFFDMSMNQKKAREAHERFASPNFVNHAFDGRPRDPNKSDREVNIMNAEAAVKNAPNLKVHILSLSVIGDLVVTQLMNTGTGGAPSISPSVDRIKDGKVVEHWVLPGVTLAAAQALAAS